MFICLTLFMRKTIKILKYRKNYFQAWDFYNLPFSNIEQQVDKSQYTKDKCRIGPTVRYENYLFQNGVSQDGLPGRSLLNLMQTSYN